MRFVHLETNVGTVGVQNLHRDSYGYLWIGNSGKGLMRYDGYEVKQYKHNLDRKDSLSGNL